MARGTDPTFAGIDIGGTNIKIAVLRQGKPQGSTSIPTNAMEGPESALARTTRALTSLTPQIQAVGVAVTGLLEEGVLREALNLAGWIDVPIHDMFASALGAHCVVMMDTIALAECERQIGQHEGRSRMFLMAIGTGVGGAYIADGRVLGCQIGLVHHQDGATPVGRNPVRLEDLVSGRAIARRATEAAQRTRTAKQVAAAAAAGDSTSIEILRDAGAHIGWAAADVTQLLMLDRVILAGGVSNSGDALIKPAQESFERLLLPHFRNRCDFVVSRIGNQSGAIGAALLAEAATRAGAQIGRGVADTKKKGALAQ